MSVYKKAISIILPLSLIVSVNLMSGCSTPRTETTPLQYANSSAITFKVKEGLMRDPKVRSYHITVSTFRDTVTLGGYVANQEQEERAIEIARSVRGVKYVVDNMAIKNS